MSIRDSKPKAYGEIHYYGADRCFNTEEVKRWNQNKILCDEIVSFDCGLFEMYEIEGQEAALLPETAQIVAGIILWRSFQTSVRSQTAVPAFPQFLMPNLLTTVCYRPIRMRF